MGVSLLIPFFLIRFGLLSVLSREAVLRAAHFPPAFRQNRVAYGIYQLSTGALLLRILFSRIKTTPLPLLCAGVLLYLAGLLLLAAAVAAFSAPSEQGVNQSGIYRLSRNPMYAAYFLLFLGCGLLIQSPLLLFFLAAFQITACRLIDAEESWCVQQFGDSYRQYMERVGRWF